MIMTTTESVPRQATAEMYGLVDGASVFSPGFTKGITAAFSAFNEGQVQEFEEIFRKARALARKEMVKRAEKLGGNAILSVRYATSEIGNGIFEVVVYGTAAKILKPGATA